MPITLANLMSAEMLDMDIDVKKAILHNKENIDLGLIEKQKFDL